MRDATIHLNGPYAPGDKDWYRCIVEHVRQNGNVVTSTNRYGSDRKEFMAHTITRIDYHD